MTSLDGHKKAEMVKKLHESVRQHIEKKNKQYATKANKGRRQVIFESGDWVWVHMRKERFLTRRRSKLHPRGDGPFQVLERINDNTYKLDLPGEYNISATFNVSDLSLFDVDDDSRSNLFEERGNDKNQQAPLKNPLHVPVGPITRELSLITKLLMEGFTVAVILGIYLCAASSVVQGVSVSCAMAYDEGGAPAVFQSPECPEWVLSMKSHQNQTGNCQFSTLQGHRAYQEDRVTCNLDMKIPFSGRDGHKEVTIGVAAVFDGHGGEQASEMASKIILDYFFLHYVFNAYKQAVSYKDKHDLVSQDHNDCEAGDRIMNLRSSQGALLAISNESLHGILKEALLRTINDIDSKFSLEAFNNGYVSGSTAAVAVLVDDQILVAFVGDSKALICSDSIQFHPDVEGILVTERYVRELTRDHHPDRADERSRIEAAGGFVSFHDVPRVNGILAMSRAIGDVYLKRYGVIGIPEVIGWQRLTTSDTYLVIASDGIFESLSPQNVCDMLGDANEMLSKEESSSSLADFIVKAAFNKGSTDNLSAIVVPLRHH